MDSLYLSVDGVLTSEAVNLARALVSLRPHAALDLDNQERAMWSPNDFDADAVTWFNSVVAMRRFQIRLLPSWRYLAISLRSVQRIMADAGIRGLPTGLLRYMDLPVEVAILRDAGADRPVVVTSAEAPSPALSWVQTNRVVGFSKADATKLLGLLGDVR